MKVLVDTCVWSLSLRRRNTDRINAGERRIIAQLAEAIQDGRAVLVGPIRQEILSGIRDQAQFLKIVKLLDPFPDEEIAAGDYIEAARLFNLCQDHGVHCGPVDILLCVVAIRSQFGILTSDAGLNRCIEVLRTEALMR